MRVLSVAFNVFSVATSFASRYTVLIESLVLVPGPDLGRPYAVPSFVSHLSANQSHWLIGIWLFGLLGVLFEGRTNVHCVSFYTSLSGFLSRSVVDERSVFIENSRAEYHGILAGGLPYLLL